MDNTKMSSMLQAINYIPVGGEYLGPPATMQFSQEDTPVDPLPTTLNVSNSTILNSTTTVTSTTSEPNTKSSLLTPTNILIGTGVVILFIIMSKK